MLYAQITGKQYVLPMEWDKAESMYRALNQLTWGYQFIAERKMFSTPGPEYRCALLKWTRLVNERESKREVLVETSDPAHMESVLFMLINEAEAQAKDYKHQLTMLGGTNGV
jgi:hypothetical protein